MIKRFILTPDSFKGTLSSQKICEIISKKISKIFPDSEIYSIPVADGGEGTVDCFLTAVGGEKKFVKCSGPYLKKIDSFYGILEGGQTAVVEMASASGLPLVDGAKNPMLTTTFGVGELVKDALDYGVKEIILGLGGSATNDFGTGFASALGVKFFNKKGEQFVPTGGTLKDIIKIDLSEIDPRVYKVKLIVMCDVDNPPYGEFGASYVFAPQKGATKEDVLLLDEGVKHLCELIKRDFNKDLHDLKGGGAAGAMACGMVAFFDAELKMGIETILDCVKFDCLLNQDSVVITGEGKIDSQSLRGKVISGIASRAKRKNVPVIAIVGGAEGDLSDAYEVGINSIFTINRLPEDFSVSRYKSEDNLARTVEDVLRLLKLN